MSFGLHAGTAKPSDMSSALEYMKLWRHKQILSQIHLMQGPQLRRSPVHCCLTSVMRWTHHATPQFVTKKIQKNGDLYEPR